LTPALFQIILGHNSLHWVWFY